MEEEDEGDDLNVLELSLDDDDLAERLMGALWPPSMVVRRHATQEGGSNRDEDAQSSSTQSSSTTLTPMKRKRAARIETSDGATRCINIWPGDEEDVDEVAADNNARVRDYVSERRDDREEDNMFQAGKRARLEEVERPQLFNMWLKMKSERRQDEQLQTLVDALVLPEDLYQHFREFIPPGASQADADRVYMRRLQYERECAERALAGCKARSWLLRRSSLNRRAVVLRVSPFGVTPELGLGLSDRMTFGANEPQRPTFYAFSYSLPGSSINQPTISHVLIMKWKNLWARCDCDDGVVITPTFFSTSFIAVLDRLLDSEGLRPERMVLGYLSARC